ncbi:MAG: hypothetical protein Q8930_12925 [Bacillota bacterium]|nr:hypothetical protein [Bacillota bacterium]
MNIRKMSKVKKVVLITVSLFVLYIPTWFIYTRFCLAKYEVIDGNTIRYKNYVYVRKDSLSETDDKNLGKTIGVAVDEKRTITDYIWPFWVMEYRDDKEHSRIFVRELMDLGSVYTKKPD